MSLEGLSTQLVLVSLLLKLFFLSVTTFELLLPRLDRIELTHYWKTDFRLELAAWALEGGAFLFSIGFLLFLDFLAAADSWVPFYVTLLLDSALLLSIVLLLFSPKKVGIAPKGVYLNGWVVQWGNIEEVGQKGNKVVLRRKGALRESKSFHLPVEKEKAEKVLNEIKEKVEKRGGV